MRLTEEEFRPATAILNEMGQATAGARNEMVLMAGSLGFSTLVWLPSNGDNVWHSSPVGCTSTRTAHHVALPAGRPAGD